MTGTVRRWQRERGFGFAAPDNESPSVFVHATDVHGLGFGALEVGQRVEFEVTETAKGPRATNVTLLASHGAVA